MKKIPLAFLLVVLSCNAFAGGTIAGYKDFMFGMSLAEITNSRKCADLEKIEKDTYRCLLKKKGNAKSVDVYYLLFVKAKLFGLSNVSLYKIKNPKLVIKSVSGLLLEYDQPIKAVRNRNTFLEVLFNEDKKRVFKHKFQSANKLTLEYVLKIQKIQGKDVFVETKTVSFLK